MQHAYFAFNAKGLKVKDVRSDHNTGYGIAAFASTHSEFSENRTSWNGEAGLYMGDSPKARNVIRKNKTDHNGIGIFMRDSTKLTATDNDAWGNCAGILALNSGHGAPWDLPAGDYKIIDNDVEGNNKACPPADGHPAFSGIGIALAGVHDVVVRDNEVKNNRSEAVSDVPKGGIVVFKFGATKATDNTVTDNEVRHNKPVDIFWDGMGTGNRFKHNECKKSMPSNICK